LVSFVDDDLEGRGLGGLYGGEADLPVSLGGFGSRTKFRGAESIMVVTKVGETGSLAWQLLVESRGGYTRPAPSCVGLGDSTAT
jgi:hypothetical protein